MIYWGLSGFTVPASITVFVDDDLVFCQYSSVFSGVSNDLILSKSLVDAALVHGKPDKILWFENPYIRTEGIVCGSLTPVQQIRSLGLDQYSFDYGDHHESAVAANFYCVASLSAHDMICLCITTSGESESMSVWEWDKQGLEKLFVKKYPHSICLFHKTMCEYLKLTPSELDQFASRGNPHRFYNELLAEVCGAQNYTDSRAPQFLFVKDMLNPMFNLRFLASATITDKMREHLAAATLFMVEQYVIALAKHVHRRFPSYETINISGDICDIIPSTVVSSLGIFNNIIFDKSHYSLGAIVAHKLSNPVNI